jgi:DNA-binding transcriptional ArsR family regulator
MTGEGAAAILRVMANPARLRILGRLAQGGEAAVGVLETGLAIKQPALSQHLGALRDSGILATRRDARSIFYRFSESAEGARAKALLAALDGSAPLPASVPPARLGRQTMHAAMFATVGRSA